jgi:uncharacterized membrane protein (DUF4010 family)
MGITVIPGPVAGLLIQTGMEYNNNPLSAVAGQPFGGLIYVIDLYGNPIFDYTGTIHITSSDSQAVLSSDVSLTPGFYTDIGLFSVTLKTAGIQNITATVVSYPSFNGTSVNIVVSPASPDNCF